jgi:enoyl-CoA hydratase/carnithine racemase
MMVGIVFATTAQKSIRRLGDPMQQFRLSRGSDAFLRATFDRPPLNLVNDTTVAEVAELADLLESDGKLKVLVLDSANPDYFMARYDVSEAPPLASATGPWEGLARFADAARRIAEAPVLSIAAIRGRARGGGSEIALACDVRFASRERAILGQPEVAFGLLPAGGGIERLSRLVGRARALEIVIGGDDFDADTAERYGWVNRSIPDVDFESFVTTFAERVAQFDRPAIAAAKRLLNRSALPTRDETNETLDALPAVVAAASGERRQHIIARARSIGPAFELDLGHNLATPADA